MASLVLTAVGSTFGPLGGVIGGALGGLLDRAALSALTPAQQVGGRLEGLQLQSTAAGAPMPAAFGKARVAGQVIWAARFKEKRQEAATGGGKGGPKAYSYSYSLSFAVAVGEGPIDGVGRIWADGVVMDLSGVTWRLHTGAADQLPDTLIEAVEGSAPAYRGAAYLVFEDLPLDLYGNRPPQLNVEVFRRPRGAPALEDRLTSVNLIPGAGEFVYATTPVLHQLSEVTWTAENVNNAQGLPDVMLALDQLQAQLPHVDHVNLVVAWFGDDLRCGRCRVRPGVEQAAKVTAPSSWRVAGIDRADAHLISTHDGGPAFGGTPSDDTVLALLAELARRGIAVTLYPFLMMDVPADNTLTDPYGGARQAAYPWRGRITGEVAPGRAGTADLTAAAATQVTAFFAEYRGLALHCASLAVQAGGCEGILIGSELRGLTTLRSAPGVYPAVSALKTLAADVKAVVGAGVKVGYAGDWSEWNGHQPVDGTAEVRFHLDPLWADPHIDFVGVDFYPPLADWRAGDGGVDGASASGPYDRAYLRANVAGAEDFDWFYATPAARATQVRTPITDGYGEPWVFRAKDLHSWWANAHHDRPAGVRSAATTAWIPFSKPIRLVEFGCPAVDRGANSPNLFVDPKSSESALPIDSEGTRDDRAQRRALEAVLDIYAPDGSGNPQSPLYGAPMVERTSAWCWDARPYPDFPARAAVWADAPNWTLGHWLTGRVGLGSAADLVTALLLRSGLDADAFEVEGVEGEVVGYVVPGPSTTADALAPLAVTVGFDAAEREARVAVRGRDGAADAALAVTDLALPDDIPDPSSMSRMLKPTPDLVRVRFLDADDSYQAGSAVLRADEPGGAGADGLDLPVVMEASVALDAARRRLARAMAERDAVTLQVSPLTALRGEAGDRLLIEGAPGAWRVLRVDVDESPRLQLARCESAKTGEPSLALPQAPPVATPAVPPVLHLLDLPPLEGFEEDGRMLAAVAASPWRAYDVSAGPDVGALTRRGAAEEPATLGRLSSDLGAGPRHRWGPRRPTPGEDRRRGAGQPIAGRGALRPERVRGAGRRRRVGGAAVRLRRASGGRRVAPVAAPARTARNRTGRRGDRRALRAVDARPRAAGPAALRTGPAAHLARGAGGGAARRPGLHRGRGGVGRGVVAAVVAGAPHPVGARRRAERELGAARAPAWRRLGRRGAAAFGGERALPRRGAGQCRRLAHGGCGHVPRLERSCARRRGGGAGGAGVGCVGMGRANVTTAVAVTPHSP